VSGGAGSLNGYRLDFQTERQRPLNWLTREWIGRKRAVAGHDDYPVQDAVFLRFLSGANPAAVPLPERVANRLRGKQDLWAGVSGSLSAVLGKTADALTGTFAPAPEGKRPAAAGPGRGEAFKASTGLIGAVLALAAVSSWLRVGFSTLIPVLLRELGLTSSVFGSVLGGSALIYAVLCPVAASLMTRFGRRGIVCFGVFLCALGSVWAAFEEANGVLMAHILVSAGLSVVVPARCEIFALLPERRRGLMNGLFEFMTNALVLATPLSSSVILLRFGWRSFMGLQASAAAVLTVAWYRMDRPADGGSRSGQGNVWWRDRIALGCCAAYVA